MKDCFTVNEFVNRVEVSFFLFVNIVNASVEGYSYGQGIQLRGTCSYPLRNREFTIKLFWQKFCLDKLGLWLGFSIRFRRQKRTDKSFQMWIREIDVSKKMLFAYPDNDYCRLDLRGEDPPTVSFLRPLLRGGRF